MGKGSCSPQGYHNVKRERGLKKGRNEDLCKLVYFQHTKQADQSRQGKQNRDNERHASHYRSDPFAVGGISFPDNSRKKRVPKSKEPRQ